ncbi:MAG: hypothetical protein JXR10_00225 [Cyclobacteriaceae bacterium]
MKYSFYIFLSAMILLACQEDTFLSDGEVFPEKTEPNGLTYPEVTNAREFSFVATGAPSLNAGGLIPTFEILEVRGPDGSAIPVDTVEKYISISNPEVRDSIMFQLESAPITEEGDTIFSYSGTNTRGMGTVTIAGSNPFSYGTYNFDIRITVNEVEQTVFENALEIYMGPKLPSGLVYVPAGQNLLVGQDGATTAPILLGTEPELVRYEIVDSTNMFTIDGTTGAISLADGFTLTDEDPLIVNPTINVISTISEEIVPITDVVTIYISTSPADIPKQVVNVFQPTMEDNNTTFGIRLEAVRNPGDYLWAFSSSVLPPAPDDRPAGLKSPGVNMVKDKNAQARFEGWMIMNTQDLSSFQYGFDVESEFYLFNQYIEYLGDQYVADGGDPALLGTSPAFIEVMISTDYLGDIEAATWTNVTGNLTSSIVGGAGPFEGLPYPGDQKVYGIDSDALKDPAKKWDGNWVHSKLNLNDYNTESSVTLAFKIHSTHEGTLEFRKNDTGSINGTPSAVDRLGRYFISDLKITAYEQ